MYYIVQCNLLFYFVQCTEYCTAVPLNLPSTLYLLLIISNLKIDRKYSPLSFYSSEKVNNEKQASLKLAAIKYIKKKSTIYSICRPYAEKHCCTVKVIFSTSLFNVLYHKKK
jgi:hypothetical protein